MKAYIGSLGIGKTYNMVKHVHNIFYKQQCMVVSNFNTTFSHFVEKDKESFLALLKEILIFKDNGYQSIDLDSRFKNTAIAIMIDEGHLVFTADQYKENRKDSTMLALMSQARKMNIHMFITSQSIHKLDKDLRTYIDEYIKYNPLIPIRIRAKVPTKGKNGEECFSREIRYPFPIFFEKHYEIPPDSPTFEEQYATYSQLKTGGYLNPKFYKMYDSNELVNREKTITTDYPLLAKIREINKDNNNEEKSIARIENKEITKHPNFEQMTDDELDIQLKLLQDATSSQSLASATTD